MTCPEMCNKILSEGVKYFKWLCVTFLIFQREVYEHLPVLYMSFICVVLLKDNKNRTEKIDRNETQKKTMQFTFSSFMDFCQHTPEDYYYTLPLNIVKLYFACYFVLQRQNNWHQGIWFPGIAINNIDVQTTLH